MISKELEPTVLAHAIARFDEYIAKKEAAAEAEGNPVKVHMTWGNASRGTHKRYMRESTATILAEIANVIAMPVSPASEIPDTELAFTECAVPAVATELVTEVAAA